MITLALALALSAQSPEPALARAAISSGEMPAAELQRLELALARAGRWLTSLQREDGSFGPLARPEVCPVALTALVLWSLEELDPPPIEPAAAARGARFLAARLQPGGGLYDPARGLAVYTSGVASRALRAYAARAGDVELARLASDVELFSRGRGAPESELDDADAATHSGARDAAKAARELLEARRASLDEAERRALDFLARCDVASARPPARLRPPLTEIDPEAFAYEDLLPYVYLDVAPEHQIARRALAALRASFTVERNPDLTRRYGPAGFPHSQGLYYYYLIAAKTLWVHGTAVLATEGEPPREAARELAARLQRLQQDDGSWRNPDGRWWEDEPLLTSAYAVLALEYCRRVLAPRAR